MSDLSDLPIFREWAERKQAGTATVFWLVEALMPELTRLVHEGCVDLDDTDRGIVLRLVEGGRVIYRVPETMPDPQVLFTHIIFSGGFEFGSAWWEELECTGVSEDGIVAPDWELKVAYGAEGETEIVEGALNASTLAQAIMRIASGAANLTDEFVTQCKLMADGRVDDVDIDAWVGDGIMQVAITGDSAVFG